MKTEKKIKKIGTKTITTTAVFSALGVVFLYIGSVFDFLDLTSSAAASLILVLAVIEGGGAVPWMIYAVTSLISALILPNKYTAVLYIFFAGLYPMVKSALEKLPGLPSMLLKLVFLNSVLALIVLVAKFVLVLPDDEIGFTKYMVLLCNGMFFLYDYLLTQLITVYLRKLRKMLRLRGIFD